MDCLWSLGSVEVWDEGMRGERRGGGENGARRMLVIVMVVVG